MKQKKEDYHNGNISKLVNIVCILFTTCTSCIHNYSRRLWFPPRSKQLSQHHIDQRSIIQASNKSRPGVEELRSGRAPKHALRVSLAEPLYLFVPQNNRWYTVPGRKNSPKRYCISGRHAIFLGRAVKIALWPKSCVFPSSFAISPIQRESWRVGNFRARPSFRRRRLPKSPTNLASSGHLQPPRAVESFGHPCPHLLH